VYIRKRQKDLLWRQWPTYAMNQCRVLFHVERYTRGTRAYQICNATRR